MPIAVLGIDLASARWRDNGSSLLRFEAGDANQRGHWTSLEVGCVAWPDAELNASRMAQTLLGFITRHDVQGLSLDGPHGWREPDAKNRPGVGRLCEFEARCQCKTGIYPTTYPRNQRAWTEYCIDLVAVLRRSGGVLVSRNEFEHQGGRLKRIQTERFYLIEAFPTSLWRTSGLTPLPSKQHFRKSKSVVDDLSGSEYWQALRSAYGLPSPEGNVMSHDDLQAIAAAIPIAALLGAPAIPVARGKDAYVDLTSDRLCEGIIWDARILPSQPDACARD
jgi:hypothetical protein